MNVNQIQSRCFKCHAALETKATRDLGLGETCEENVRAAFLADREAFGGTVEISGDALFNLLAIFAGDNNAAPVQALANELINVTKLADLQWTTIRNFFVLARTLRDHGDDSGLQQLFAVLGTIAPRMTAMSLGEASTDAALLDYDGEKVTLTATTVREGSEQLAKIKGVARYGRRVWSFPLRGAPAVAAIVAVRWPFAVVTDAFKSAVVEALALPEEPPAPKMFKSELVLDWHVVTYEVKKGGRYVLDFNDGDELSRWIRSDEIGGAYYKAKSTKDLKFATDAVAAYLVPADALAKVEARLEELYAPKPTKRGRK